MEYYITNKDKFSVCITEPMSSFTQKLFVDLFQPLLSNDASSLYMSLHGLIQIGQLESKEIEHKTLLKNLRMNTVDAFLTARYELEALGLIDTYVYNNEDDTNFYVYLVKKLPTAWEFFHDEVLSTLLQNALGIDEFTEVAGAYLAHRFDLNGFKKITINIDDLYQIVFNGVIYDNVKLIKTNELIFDNIKLTNKLSIIDIFEISYNKYGYIGDVSTFVVKVNNPLDVLLTKISLYVNGKPLFACLQKINDEHYMFNYENIDLGRMSIKVNELFYLVEDDTNKINSNYESVLNFVVLSSINKEYLEPTIISTKEELMNIDKYGSYILGCSIDMEEEEFKFDDFYGYFNGNGYSIKNLKIEYEECKIFNNINGVVENIYFENILFNVLCNDIVKTNLIYDKLNGSISNIYLSGVINTFGLDVEVITNDSLTIVDKLIINGNDIFYPKKISSELFNDIDVKNELFNKNNV